MDTCRNCYEFKDYRDCRSPYSKKSNEKGYCDFYHEFNYPDDYCNHFKNVDTYVPGSCYITTIICHILGYDDNMGDLEDLRLFRQNVLQKDEKYSDLLYEYDQVGPYISMYLYNDYMFNKDKEFPILLYNFYIQPTVRYIRDKKYDEAILRYKELTNMLEDYYSIDKNINKPSDYDFKNGGHGFELKKV